MYLTRGLRKKCIKTSNHYQTKQQQAQQKQDWKQNRLQIQRVHYNTSYTYSVPTEYQLLLFVHFIVLLEIRKLTKSPVLIVQNNFHILKNV